MNKKQHLIALDLDGTLLNDNKEISQRTMQTIIQVISEGHIVVIATGRPKRASIQYYKQLNLQTPMVNFNGALTHHPYDKRWGVHHQPLPKKTAMSIIEACYDLGVNNILAEVQDNAYLDRHDQNIIDAFESIQKPHKKTSFTIGKMINVLKEEPTSILIHPRQDHIDQLNKELQFEHAELIEYRSWDSPWHMVEIIKKGINKAIGLNKIANHFQIPKERIIAFGDEDNDLEMIDYAGIGVAMENGINELKSIADHVTDTNEKDGVSVFLEQYLKLQIPVP